MTNDARSPYSWLDHESQHALQEIDHAANWGNVFPRDLAEVIPLVLPAAIVHISNLAATHANRWLRSRGRADCFESNNRLLHGCFLGNRDYGFIFVEKDDSEGEQRYTIAHETGHFMLDHLLPRRRAVERFGLSIKEVMDGERKPTISESFRSVIKAIPIGQSVNLMERRTGGQNALDLYASEHRADRFALALLAPPDSVIEDMRGLPNRHARATATELLVEKYGLPTAIATDYAGALLSRMGKAKSPYGKVVRA